LKSKLVYASDSTRGGLRCLGELEGVMQDVNILERKATPDPTATGIDFWACRNELLKVYPAALHYSTDSRGYVDKKPTTRLTNGLHNCAVGYRDLFQDGVQSLLFLTSAYSSEHYSEETLVIGKETPSHTYTSRHPNLGTLLMVTPFSRYSKYLEIKRSLRVKSFKSR